MLAGDASLIGCSSLRCGELDAAVYDVESCRYLKAFDDFHNRMVGPCVEHMSQACLALDDTCQQTRREQQQLISRLSLLCDPT